MVAIASAPVAFKPALLQQKVVRASRAQRVAVRASSNKTVSQDALVKSAAFASVATSFLAAGNAQAAMEVANIAAGDSRAGLLFLPLGAAIAWVGVNILPGLKNQLDAMAEKNSKSVAAGLGLGAASLLAAQGADAAEIMEIAAGDSRAGLLFLPLVAAIGWVGVNILPGLKNQLDAMAEKNSKSVAAGLGLGAASLLVAQNADAATEIMDLAAGDNRFAPVLGIFALVLGWVGFNMLQPTLNQLDAMSSKNKK